MAVAVTSPYVGPVNVHPEVCGFDLRADDYEKGRPGYPSAAVGRLAEATGIGRGTRVLDLAAGTGKLTRQLLATGADVVAVEPVAGMRAVMARALPEVEVLEGTAEDIPLPAGVVQAVTVGQAFHWFRGDEALAEIRRVLTPGGHLGVIFNVRDVSQPLQAAVGQVIERYRGNSPSQETAQWKGAFSRTALFGPLSHQSFAMEQRLTPDGLVSRVLSISFMACLPPGEQQKVAAEVAGLVAPGTTSVGMKYVTDVYWCQALA